MRHFRVLPLLSLLLGARAYSLGSRDPTTHRLDRRATSDVCATVHSFLALSGTPRIDACLCLSDLPVFLETNDAMITAASQVGEEHVTFMLTSLINYFAPSSGCLYPEHSTPSCVDGSPCGFQCTDGFTPSPSSDPTSCVCGAPSVICNGKCVAAGPCPSNQPVRKKTNWVSSKIFTDMGPGWVACGVLSGLLVNLKAVMASCSPLWPTLLLARTAQRSPALPISSSAAPPRGTYPLSTALAAFTSAAFHNFVLPMRRTRLRGFMDSNAFHLGRN